MRRVALGCLLAAAVLCMPPGAGPSWAQSGVTHTVQPGDTLWDLCAHYYGDPWLWPKLWQMNPFITNPHLLRPGDVIKLLDDVPFKRQPHSGQKAAAIRPAQSGVDVSDFTRAEAVGFLFQGAVDTIGRVSGANRDLDLVGPGQGIYVTLDRAAACEAGKLLTVFRPSGELRDPRSGAPIGRAARIVGRLRLEGGVDAGLCRASVVEAYQEMHPGDGLRLWKPSATCVRVRVAERPIRSWIAAAQDERALVGQFSVVYLAHGSAHGIRAGQLFDVLEAVRLPHVKKNQAPRRVLGQILVLDSRPQAAAGVVVKAVEEIPPGATVRSMGRGDTERLVATLPRCPLE